MKIDRLLWQNRNDFEALLECEHCQHTQVLKTGYNDAYYHTKVLPSITCEKCKLDRRGNASMQDSQGTVPV